MRACLAVALATATTACAGAVQMTMLSGACDEQHQACLKACGELKDPRDCELSCDFDSRMCSRRQDGSDLGLRVADSAKVGRDQALLVDLFGHRIQHSSDAEVAVRGDVQPVEGAHALAPGGSLAVDFTLPAMVREAELMLTHGPGGDGTKTFITVTVGDRTLLGRYAPPRPGAKGAPLRVETFNLTPMLGDVSKPQKMKLFIYNNENAGSREPYHLAGVQLTYKVIESSRP